MKRNFRSIFLIDVLTFLLCPLSTLSQHPLHISGGILPNIQASAHDDSLREKRRVLKMGEFSPLKKNVDRSLLGLSGGRFY